MATETVSIVFTFKGGRMVGAKVDGLTRKFGKLAQKMTLTQRIAKSLRGTMSTISKALISGFAITAVFGAIYTVVNSVRTAFKLLKNEVVDGIMAVADFQEQTLTLQGIIATTVRWSEDLETNFAKAGKMAQKVQIEFLKRTGEIIGTSNDAALVFQTLLGQGVAGLVDNMQEAVDLSILFTNSIIAVTPGQDKQRQLASETAAFLRGQVRATDRLAKLLGLSASELTKMRDNARDAKDFFQQLKPKLEAMERASKEFGNTWTGITTSMRDLIKIIRLQVFTSLFDKIRLDFASFRDRLLEDIDKVGAVLIPIGATLTVIYENMKNIFKNWIANGPTLVDIVDSFTMALIKTYVWGKRTLRLMKLLWDASKLQNASMSAFYRGQGAYDDITKSWDALTESFDKVFSGPTVDHEIQTLIWQMGKEVKAMELAWEEMNSDAGLLGEKLPAMGGDAATLAKHAKAFADQMARVEQMRAESKTQSLQNIAPNLFPFADINDEMGKLADSVAEVFTKQGIEKGSKMWRDMEATLKELNKQKHLERVSESTKKVNAELARNVTFWARVRANMSALEFPEAVLVAVAELNRLTAESVLGQDAPEHLRKFAAAAMRRAKFQAKTGALGITVPGIDEGPSLQEASADIRETLQDPAKNYNNTAIMLMIGDLEGLNEMLHRLGESYLDLDQKAMQAFTNMINMNETAAGAAATNMDKIKAGAGVLLAGVAKGMAEVFRSVFEGSESIASAIGKLVGGLLVQLGTFLVTAGLMAIAAAHLGAFFPFLRGAVGGPEGLPAAIMAIAVGTAAIAAGVALGGMGGGKAAAGAGGGGGGEAGMTTYMVDQKDISVNAAINSGITELNGTLGSMKAASPGDVWTVGAKQNGGVMTVASKEATGGATASQTQSLGGSVTGGRG